MWEMDYDSAASYWQRKDEAAKAVEADILQTLIDEFIEAHNTCALATASTEHVRCTPIEYNYVDGAFYLFSEGGLKFKGLRDNKHVGLAIFEPYSGFGSLKGLQVEGTAEMIEPFSDEYLMLLKHKKIPADSMKKLPTPMNLIKIKPTAYDLLDSELKQEGYSSRQHLDVAGA